MNAFIILADSGNAAALVTDIMRATWDDDDGEEPIDGNDLFVTRGSVDYLERWEEFLAAVRERDFPDLPGEDLRRYEACLPAGTTTFYRARRGFDPASADEKRPWSGKEIGANPNGEASRANRAGRVVLYCAEQMKTAVAEVHPTRGLIVSVAQLRLTADVTVLDLVTAARESAHLDPFRTEGAELPYWLELHGLLFRFAWAMAKSLEHDDNPPSS